jgi:hypothetical protein
MLNVIYAKCCKMWLYAECRHAECCGSRKAAASKNKHLLLVKKKFFWCQPFKAEKTKNLKTWLILHFTMIDFL